MAVAEIKFDYFQILNLARQLSMSEREQLCADVLKEPEEKSWAEIFDMFPKADISEEEILEECRAVRKEHYLRNHAVSPCNPKPTSL